MSEITDKEFTDAMAIAEHISDEAIIEELDRLIEREKSILDEETDIDPEMREITIYNVIIMSTAVARIKVLNKLLKSAG